MARPATVFAKIANQEQRDRLVELWKQHPNHYTRTRAHAIILSDARYEVEQIIDIFGVSRDSVRSWIKRFEEGGPDALLDEDKPGAPRKLDRKKSE